MSDDVSEQMRQAMAEQAAKMTDEEREQIQQAFALVSEGICPTCRGALDRLRSMGYCPPCNAGWTVTRAGLDHPLFKPGEPIITKYYDPGGVPTGPRAHGSPMDTVDPVNLSLGKRELTRLSPATF